MGQAKVARAAGLTNRDLGYTHKSSSTTPSTEAQTRRAAITQPNAIAAKYTNNTTKLGWVANVSPKQK
jgi:archaellum component FlaG (FlaF/FlaG flagellin family)